MLTAGDRRGMNSCTRPAWALTQNRVRRGWVPVRDVCVLVPMGIPTAFAKIQASVVASSRAMPKSRLVSESAWNRPC
jgi:hypothetical protein